MIVELGCTDPTAHPIGLEALDPDSSSSLDAKCWLREDLLFDSSENTPFGGLVELIVEVVCGSKRILAMGPLLFLLLCHPLPSKPVLLR